MLEAAPLQKRRVVPPNICFQFPKCLRRGAVLWVRLEYKVRRQHESVSRTTVLSRLRKVRPIANFSQLQRWNEQSIDEQKLARHSHISATVLGFWRLIHMQICPPVVWTLSGFRRRLLIAVTSHCVIRQHLLLVTGNSVNEAIPERDVTTRKVCRVPLRSYVYSQAIITSVRASLSTQEYSLPDSSRSSQVIIMIQIYSALS